MNPFVFIGLFVFAAFLVVSFYFLLRHFFSSSKLESQTKDIVNQVFGELSQKIIQQTKQVLESEKEAIYKDNLHKREIIENIVKDLRRELDQRQKEIRQLEQDRNKKFGDISRAIEEHRKITSELKTSTETLANVLSNNQQRGQWGERIIEDILTNAGLIEHIHYEKQKPLGDSSLKPDIILLLPNKKKVAVDVKFPYSEIQKLASADSKTAKTEHIKKFERDVKAKINQITKYIDPEKGTMDYAIMFVPNEMLFSFINQQLPSIIDEAMAKKIMITSPFTFLIVARTVMESYRNFMVENNLRKIIQYISDFIEEWSRFTQEFNKFDEAIDKLRASFDKIQTTRYKQMSLRIKRIEKYRQGDVLQGELSSTP